MGHKIRAIAPIDEKRHQRQIQQEIRRNQTLEHEPLGQLQQSPKAIADQLHENTKSNGDERQVSKDASWDDPKEIEKRDKPVKPHWLQIGIPGSGKGIETVAKLLVMGGKIAIGLIVRTFVGMSNDARQKEATKTAIRESMSAHEDRMRSDPKERASEQSAVDRQEHRERVGDDTMVA